MCDAGQKEGQREAKPCAGLMLRPSVRATAGRAPLLGLGCRRVASAHVLAHAPHRLLAAKERDRPKELERVEKEAESQSLLRLVQLMGEGLSLLCNDGKVVSFERVLVHFLPFVLELASHLLRLYDLRRRSEGRR